MPATIAVLSTFFDSFVISRVQGSLAKLERTTPVWIVIVTAASPTPSVVAIAVLIIAVLVIAIAVTLVLSPRTLRLRCSAGREADAAHDR